MRRNPWLVFALLIVGLAGCKKSTDPAHVTRASVVFDSLTTNLMGGQAF